MEIPAADSLPLQGITNSICKESACLVAVSGKSDHASPASSDSKSMAWGFFTDDGLPLRTKKTMVDV
jgi:hypothetical protein